MSSIIQTVAYKQNDAKSLKEKLSEHLGIHRLTIALTDGESVEGVLSEIGKDYISVIVDEFDMIIPIKNLKYFRYSP